MKTKLCFLFAAITVLYSSCSTTKYTHSQVMDREVLNQSKYGILNKYGNPTQIRESGSYEEWIYNLSQKTPNNRLGSNSKKNVNVNSSSDKGTNNINAYGSSSLSNIYTNYIKITFLNGRVTKWETKGVDYAVKDNKSGLATLLIISTLVMSMSIGLGVLSGNSMY